eukprot:15360841-Ditylum_brightwellii.AAC.2
MHPNYSPAIMLLLLLLFGVIELTDSAGHIIVTKNDKLCGQGKLTNHHRKNTGPRHCEPSPGRLHTIYKGAEAFCINPNVTGQCIGLDASFLLLPITKEPLPAMRRQLATLVSCTDKISSTTSFVGAVT